MHLQVCTHFRESTEANKRMGSGKVKSLSRLMSPFPYLKYKQRLVEAFTEQILPHFSMESPQRLLPVLDRVYPVTAIQEAHAYMESNKNMGKIVLELPQ